MTMSSAWATSDEIRKAIFSPLIQRLTVPSLKAAKLA